MSTSAVQPLAAGSPAVPAAPASTADNSPSSLANEDVFLQLLVAQLQNQDPESPADGTQFVTQLAQFSTLEQDTQSASDLNQILTGVDSLVAALPAAASTPAVPQANASTSAGTS
jgi:flagellar basal-body rod modification protein FlgD